MASPRRVTVTLEILEPAARALPALADALHGLDDSGWVTETALLPDGNASERVQVTLWKDFIGASPLAVSDDVRACGVTDDLSPVFAWSADRGDDDDGCWDGYQGEL